jgi:hypothetical protein
VLAGLHSRPGGVTNASTRGRERVCSEVELGRNRAAHTVFELSRRQRRFGHSAFCERSAGIAAQPSVWWLRRSLSSPGRSLGAELVRAFGDRACELISSATERYQFDPFVAEKGDCGAYTFIDGGFHPWAAEGG